MRKLAALIGIALVCLAGTSSAAANSTPAELGPTAEEIEWAHAVALAYWHAYPPCGDPKVAVGGPEDHPPYAAAMVDWNTCTINMATEIDFAGSPAEACRVFVHEWGHLLLGPDYFSAVNPADPAHSPDATNVMYGGTATWEQIEAQDRSVGCVLEPQVSRSWLQPRFAPHGHRGRKHRRLKKHVA